MKFMVVQGGNTFGIVALRRQVTFAQMFFTMQARVSTCQVKIKKT